MKHSQGFLRLVRTAKGRIREVRVDQVREKLKRRHPFRFVDVREDHEWKVGYAKGAEHIARGILERDVETAIPDKKTEIVLYCGGGFRSALSAESLRKMGYRNVLSMAGGFRAWKAARAPVVRSRPRPRRN
ncbi:MAG: sulfurtransferase [Candidatus Dadabacteria bacterium]|nr:sulfurtransferase [Candidatus Dadabacteria bacterium]